MLSRWRPWSQLKSLVMAQRIREIGQRVEQQTGYYLSAH